MLQRVCGKCGEKKAVTNVTAKCEQTILRDRLVCCVLLFPDDAVLMNFMISRIIEHVFEVYDLAVAIHGDFDVRPVLFTGNRSRPDKARPQKDGKCSKCHATSLHICIS
jgi:hypothetical protein